MLIRFIHKTLMVMFASAILSIGCAEQKSNDANLMPNTEAEVRELLVTKDFREGHRILAQAGPSVFPLYRKILADPETFCEKKTLIYSVLKHLECDKTQFYPFSLEHVQDRECLSLRIGAKHVLWQVATVNDIPYLSTLLNDGATSSIMDTARVLSQIGDQNALDAINVWLAIRGTSHPQYYIKHVTESRDQLKARLDKQKQHSDKQ